MVTIRLHNTKSRRKEEFKALDDANVRMYVCGPTVYDRAHLGNARPVVVFDVLFRLLRHVYGPDHVTYVRNFTDVDDKINATALARKAAGDARSLEALIRTTFSDEGDDKSSVLVSRLIESLDHDIRLVRALQHTHDNSEVKEWPDVLLAVACEYSLDGSIIAEAFA